MVTWAEFEALRPELAEAGRALLYQFGVGLAFLATVSADGLPRVHPFCPLLGGGDLRAFIVASPKRSDLRRTGRYAMHSFPCPANEDAFYLAGQATILDDADLVASSSRQFIEERPGFAIDLSDQILFRFEVDRCLLSRTTGHGDPSPVHTVWPAPSA
ncbi:MAG: pyridoxamine 5'-phosphate oxidase family protein [Acidimicrobiales bacterium]